DLNPGNAFVVERRIGREILRRRDRELLVDAAERRIPTFLRRRIPVREIEARRDADIPLEPVPHVTVDGEPAFAPGRRGDRRLDEVAERAIVLRRLVVLVQEADRNEEEAGAATDAVGKLALSVELLDLDFALVRGRGDRVLDLELGGHTRALVEAMRPTEN